jgi:hypothetical protein
MKVYLSNRLFKIGAIIALVGWTPLLAIIILAWIGLWPDPLHGGAKRDAIDVGFWRAVLGYARSIA